MGYSLDPCWERGKYARLLHAIQFNAATFPFGRYSQVELPAGLVPRDLDFLWPDTKLFHSSHALYSAGVVAQGEPHRLARPVDDVVSRRDIANTFVLLDSGGFSVANSGLAITNDYRVLQKRWAERLEAQASVVVDAPTAAVEKPSSTYHGDFRRALRDTVESLELWARDREPNSVTEFANVFQGNNPAQAKELYGAVRKYGGRRVAWGGPMRKNFAHVLRRMLQTREDGWLDELEHLHVLGVADPGYALLFTALKRALSDHLQRPFVVTFDAATAHLYAFRDLVVVQPGLRWDTLNLTTRRLEAAGKSSDRDTPAPLHGSELGRLGLSMADLRRRGHRAAIGWDEPGRLMLVNHNVEMLNRAIIEANRQADLPDNIGSPIPQHLRDARAVIAELFTRKDPSMHIRRWASVLTAHAPDQTLTEEDR